MQNSMVCPRRLQFVHRVAHGGMEAGSAMVFVVEVWEDDALSEGGAKAGNEIRLGPCMACIS